MEGGYWDAVHILINGTFNNTFFRNTFKMLLRKNGMQKVEWPLLVCPSQDLWGKILLKFFVLPYLFSQLTEKLSFLGNVWSVIVLWEWKYLCNSSMAQSPNVQLSGLWFRHWSPACYVYLCTWYLDKCFCKIPKCNVQHNQSRQMFTCEGRLDTISLCLSLQ